MHNEFYKVTCYLYIFDGDLDLLFLEKWLEKRLKIFLHSIANVTATQGSKTENQPPPPKKNIKSKLTHFTILHHDHSQE